MVNSCCAIIAVKVIAKHPVVPGAVRIAKVVLGAVCVTGAVLFQSDSVLFRLLCLNKF